ncbi:MAG: cytochrome C oxidase subunit IV family protein [Sulfurimicrobium sp.]|nr:cytochrome C oxidase subunit IV family protein [Sulfurimicrobium sp.]MDP1705706.1 cytochrome C oxidase subunit IV family protein [Sulfurimicrobium sp.]MDP2200286.1 cytochrome C oxidase subunit IV family protein [Sulfurimicrobium sp.]MDP3687967.1 cytochrome C oxidase subunit IV family protein [Sulfurimicrobium sp.]
MDKPHKPHFIRACTYIWLALIILTCITYAIGETGWSGTAVMLTVLGTAVIKVEMVASYFMGLRRTRWLWRGIVLGWLILVSGLITIAYFKSLG